MATDRFFIAPYDSNSGQQTNVKPWLIPDQAFEELTNAYVFRGRVRKRFGSRWFLEDPLLSRFRVQVAVIAGQAAAGSTPSGDGAIGQQFSIGSNIFTVNATGTPANLLVAGTAATATFNTTSGAFSFTGVPVANNTPVYWYPALPVMGLTTFENSAVNNETIIGFDTRYAYGYNSGWYRLDGEATPGAATWTGDNSQFFWTTTWTGANASDKVFFVTNFNENEPNFMRYFFNNQWNNFRPAISSTEFLNAAEILVPFKNRLVAFNTWEGAASPGSNYPNRCRYSQIGSPLAVDAWRQDIPGKGNSIDAATTEAIVTVEFIKDRLIVFFERSTWELVYTGNQAYPFTWQQINTELGAESTFSIVPFDKVAIGVGNVGIHACNGANVERIDDKIPDTVFDIHNTNDGIFRVYGIRDYFVEMIYWTFPDIDADADFPYPSRVLVYNYKTGTWAFNEDSITVFGYFQPQTGSTWDSTTITWDDDISWSSGSVQALFRQVVAGNQEGFTFICDADVTTNAAVLQITDVTSGTYTMLTIIDHNFRVGEYIYIQNAQWSDASNSLNNTIYEIVSVPDSDTIGIDAAFTGTYNGGGLVARVSNIVIKTKQYNFYANTGRNAYVSKVDFMVDKTDAGRTQVEFFVSTAVVPLLQDAAGSGVLVGTGTLDTFPYTAANGAAAPIPFEETASRLWHPVYFQADGEVVQFQLIMNDEQMRDLHVRKSGFQLHAMCIYAQPTSYRFQ